MSTQLGPGLVSNTGNPTTGDSKPALDVVRRWNDGVNRHTLYTACGTQQDGWGIYNEPTSVQARADLLTLINNILAAGGLSPIQSLPSDGSSAADLGLASPDTVVGARVNKDLWNWVPVSYPASAPGAPANLDNGWQPNNLSMVDSMTIGANQMISLIKNTPGTFALCGMSQGAVVISQVLRAMQPNGVLANRYNDCIGAVAFGNPCRRQGAGMPGVSAGSNAGLTSRVVGPVSGLATTPIPDWWWEMSTPGDFFSDAPMSAAGGAVGTLLTKIAAPAIAFKGVGFDALTNITNIVNLLVNVSGPVFAAARTVTNIAALRAVGLWLRDLGLFAGLIGKPVFLGIIQGLLKLTPAEMTPTLLAGNYPYGNPHMFYGVWKPPAIPTAVSGLVNPSTATYVDVAVAYLNRRGSQIAPRASRTRTL